MKYRNGLASKPKLLLVDEAIIPSNVGINRLGLVIDTHCRHFQFRGRVPKNPSRILQDLVVLKFDFVVVEDVHAIF